MTALKQQNGNGVKGNRQFNKPDFVSPHRPSKLNLNDERVKKVKILIKRPRRYPNGITHEIESFKVLKETEKWVRDGFSVELI